MAYLTETPAAGGARGPLTALDRVIDRIGVVPLAVWGILGLALCLRLAVVSFGLPQELDSDEETFVEAALLMVHQRTLDPSWYGNPASTLLDVLAALYAAHGLLGVLTGAADHVASVYRDYREDVSHFLLVGRLYTALVGAAVILVVYAIARELRISNLWSAVAALVVAVSGAMIVYSTTIRSDMLQILFLLLIVYVMTRALTRPTAASFVVAGTCLGLAVTSKYPGLVGVVPILAAVGTLGWERKVRVGRALTWLMLAAVASVIAAFIVGPFLFLDFQAVLDDVRYEARAQHLGATSAGFLPGMWAYLTEALPAALGWIGTILAVAGSGAMLADRRPRLTALLFWAYLVFISVLPLWWERWTLPLLPLAAIAIAYVLDRIDARARADVTHGWDPRRITAVRLLAVALVVLPVLVPAASLVLSRATNDATRVVAAAWVDANVPDGSTLLVESLTPNLSSERYRILIARRGELVSWPRHRKLRTGGSFGRLGGSWCRGEADLPTAIREQEVDYILLSGSFVEEFRTERADYSCEVAVYEQLLALYPVIETVDREDASLGGPVLVLDANARRPGDARAPAASGPPT